MNEFLIQPAVYTTGEHRTLFDVLEQLWPLAGDLQSECYYLVSGFGTFNGGVSFFERFRNHVSGGGRVRAFFAGSTSSNVTSLQLVQALMDCGVEVAIMNRRYMMHSKLYGKKTSGAAEVLAVASGNFTAPGIARNVESVMVLEGEILREISFSWDSVFSALDSTGEVFYVNGAAADDPRWKLLYDESRRESRVPAAEDEGDLYESLILTLSHADTARIVAARGTSQGAGSQYFWISKDSYSFFPPLVIRNSRGVKATYSCEIFVTYEDLGVTSTTRVTFEAENNLDFRLGTGPLRYTGIANEGDMAVVTRRGEANYTIKIVKKGSPEFFALSPFAQTFIGARGKRYGYGPNASVDAILGRKP